MSGVVARLGVKPILRFEQISLRGPCMRGAARNLVVPEVPGSRPAMLRCELELRRGLVAQLRRRLERLAQFQTLTSR